jgi:WD40 repeat protein
LQERPMVQGASMEPMFSAATLARDGILTGSLPRPPPIEQGESTPHPVMNAAHTSPHITTLRPAVMNTASPPPPIIVSPSAHASFTFEESYSNVNWKYIYQQRLLLQRHWVQGNCVCRDFVGHDEAIYCLQFDSEKIISGSRDRKSLYEIDALDSIKIWNMKTGYNSKTLQGHQGSVLCLQYDQDYLLSGSSDSTIIKWDIKTLERLGTLNDHTESVLNLKFNHQHVVSCSKDRTIKVWDFHTGQLTRTLVGHRAAVNAVQFHKNIIVSASGGNLN